jgi:hypothetical protein
MVKRFNLPSDPAIPTRRQESISWYTQIKLRIVRDTYIDDITQIAPAVAPPTLALAAVIAPAAAIAPAVEIALAAAIAPAAAIALPAKISAALASDNGSPAANIAVPADKNAPAGDANAPADNALMLDDELLIVDSEKEEFDDEFLVMDWAWRVLQKELMRSSAWRVQERRNNEIVCMIVLWHSFVLCHCVYKWFVLLPVSCRDLCVFWRAWS